VSNQFPGESFDLHIDLSKSLAVDYDLDKALAITFVKWYQKSIPDLCGGFFKLVKEHDAPFLVHSR